MNSARRLALALTCICVCALTARANDDGAARVSELFQARELGQALAACEQIGDPVLRAEWRFHVLYNGGDLAAALDAALAGLEHTPAHAGLSQNALVAALKLRRADIASRVREQLISHSAAVPESLAAEVDRTLELERSATNRTQRARVFVIASAVAVFVALGVFTRSVGR